MGTVDVLDGVVLNKGKFLAEKKKANRRIDPGIVCLLGEHVEPQETRDSAYERNEGRVERRSQETKTHQEKLLGSQQWRKTKVHYYLVLAYEGKPICRAAEEILWLENNGEIDIETDR